MALAAARTADYARLVAVPAIWGGTFVAGKHVVAVLSPMMGSFARYVIACVALLVAAFALEGGLPKLSRKQWIGDVRARRVRRVRLQPVFHGLARAAAGEPRRAHHRAQSGDHHHYLGRWCSRNI